MANRLLEANDRSYWNPDPETIAALQEAADTLENPNLQSKQAKFDV